MIFPTQWREILERIDAVDPIKYSKDRNYLDGSVSYLSPYISRGVISTKFVLERLLKNGFDPFRIEKFVQELAWRDFWQLQWKSIGNIDLDVKNSQSKLRHQKISQALLNSTTGINAVDDHIDLLKKTGYMHNHMRMYTASIECNIGGAHWLQPAKWMYYHLLDGDWASNALSWQWVAGTNSNKKYLVNQENINHYSRTKQLGSFLDGTYEELATVECPPQLLELDSFKPEVINLKFKPLILNPEIPTLIYTTYNLDPNWRSNEKVNRVLLFDREQLELYPIAPNVIDFIISLAQNISDIQFYFGTYSDLKKEAKTKEFIFKEHPFSENWEGKMDERDWMFNVQNKLNSFFPFWKQGRKQLKSYVQDA